MLNWYKNLDIYKKTCITSLLVSLIAFLGCIPLYFYNLAEIPNGIALSGVVCSSLFLFYEIGKSCAGLGKTIFVNILRFGLLIALLFVTVFLYYKFEIKIFNVFAVVGVLFASTVIFVVLSYLESKNDNSSNWRIIW